MPSAFQNLSQAKATASIYALDVLCQQPTRRRFDIPAHPAQFAKSSEQLLCAWQQSVLEAFRALVGVGEVIHVIDPDQNHESKSLNPHVAFELGATKEELAPTRFVANRWQGFFPLANGDSFAFVDSHGTWALSLEQYFSHDSAVILLGSLIIEALQAIPPGSKEALHG